MHDTPIDIPRILIAALRGGSGKTLLSIGITAALRRNGKAVAPFKKGPDYIDAGWLALAAGRPCFNLDTFMSGDAAVRRSFLSRTLSSAADLAVIEGNRGLYDGLDADGTTSTASLAKLLSAPVILCLDCTKSTRTMAAVVLGCLHFDPDVMIRGVILNQVAGSRHEGILRQSIETHCGVPVIGAVPKLRRQHFPERHMGLVPAPEHSWATDSVAAIADLVKDSVNLVDLLDIAESARGRYCPDFFTDRDSGSSPEDSVPAPAGATCTEPDTNVVSSCSLNPDDGAALQLSFSRPRIGVIRDAAFQFYYPENLEALEQAGADLVFFSSLTETSLPDIHALYIGGGFPETHAAQLSENTTLRNDIRSAAADGLPVYAECGGLMYLGESLVLDRAYPMTGVLPMVFGFSKKPRGHGYTIARVERETPYYPSGTVLKGHEFHYSRVLEWRGDEEAMTFSMERGCGICNRRDGVRIKNVLATYTHIHALGTPAWAPALARLAGNRAAEHSVHGVKP